MCLQFFFSKAQNLVLRIQPLFYNHATKKMYWLSLTDVWQELDQDSEIRKSLERSEVRAVMNWSLSTKR